MHRVAPQHPPGVPLARGPVLLPSRAVILTLGHPRQGGLPSAENHHRLHRAKKDTYSPPDRARGRTEHTRTPPRALSNIVYTKPVDPRRIWSTAARPWRWCTRRR